MKRDPHPQDEAHGPMRRRGAGRLDMPSHSEPDGGSMDREEMERHHHQRTLWAPLGVVILGAWLLSSPFTFGYAGPMRVSDAVSGALLLALGSVWTATPRWASVPWAACFVGVWLQFAPLLFWAPSAAAYVTDTFVGAWVIALTVLIPGMPPMIRIMRSGPAVPPGWSYNPSSWVQRFPLAVTGFLGWFVSRYLAAFQLGYLPAAWDPFFGDSTALVLTSEISRAWPISDAGLGAAAYTFEALMAFMGGTQRWRTMPWMVTFFGILVIPLGFTHILLVISQPVLVGQWCTLCLLAAAIMLVMIPLTVDEVVAMCQFLRRRLRAGQPFWRTFWKGGTDEGGEADDGSPAVNRSPARTFPAMLRGVSFPWTLLVSAAAGLWLMCAPAVFGTSGPAADSDHLAGALALSVAVMATAEVIRSGRYLNVLFGIWIAASPFLLSGSQFPAQWNALAVGGVLIFCSLPRGRIVEGYGSWDKRIR